MRSETFPDAPFVLLDDARGDARARLYRAPHTIVRADRIEDVEPALAAIREATRNGAHAAGFLAYEAGGAFEPRMRSAFTPTGRLAWFGLFDGFELIDPARLLPDPAGAIAMPPEPTITRDRYDAMIRDISALIAAGDIYQANLTFQATVRFLGDPLALYARLRAAARAGVGAVVATGGETYLSLSPELFFALDGDRIVCRPMKGTMRRDADPARDAQAATALVTDEKQRAENLMIVDLMRNDLSRVATAGSVAVPELFVAERYPTVHQMTSTVTATLTPGKDAIDVIAALFPCGSITGAPKLRAMEVIAAVEGAPRGLYTGSIGRIDPSGDAKFNVAIRTLSIARDADHAMLGLGGGIVADSTAAEEWSEALAKGGFVTHDGSSFDLLETMRFDPEEGLLLIERHLTRMKESAVALGFAFNRHDARNDLQAATFRLRRPVRVRLLLARSGRIAIDVAPVPPAPAAPLRVALVTRPVPARDIRLRHKTSARAFYDDARRAAGTDEVALLDDAGFVTEGSFTNIFVERGGVLLTPPLARGLLPGVLRAELIASGRAREADLRSDDLANGFHVGNALRGLLPAIVAVAKSPTRQL